LVNVGVSAPFPLLGGFAFFDSLTQSDLWRDFPAGRLAVPSILLQEISGDCVLRVTVPVTPGATPAEVQVAAAMLSYRARWWSEPEAGSAAVAPFALEAGNPGRRTGFTHLPNPCPSGPSPSGPGNPDADSPDYPFHLHSLPNRADWKSSVSVATSLIRGGRIAKVVLAREERVISPLPFSAIGTLARLRDFDPTATIFAMQSGASWFVGATPERLVRLDRGRVDVTCLAGSIGIGDTDEEREALAMQLLASEKDRNEHEIVVESTLAALREVCDLVQRDTGTPRVIVARSVQHLATPVTGRLNAEGQVLDLVARLHPTPAVGGFPRDGALDVIRELESIDRGWYAGPFGWTDLDGAGEFSVAIRSALLRGTTASVFAGCGIVADSDPEAEFVETCLKMRPMLAALSVE
jgi:isochorismate synthase